MINLVVALPAEARPLINHYRLKHRQAQSAFPLYGNDGMALVVSGPGKIAAAAATAWLAGLTGEDRRAAWLNIGIAGHATHDIGTGLLVNRITDRASNRSWYPPQVHDLDIPASRLLCVDAPENDYRADALYEMEASGFYATACRFTTGELVQCFKVVSDNRQQSSAKVSTKLCTQLLAGQLGPVDRVVGALRGLQQQYHDRHSPHPDHERMIDHWHFSVSQQHRLSRLLQRWMTLAPGRPAWSSTLKNLKTASAVLQHLEQQLDV